MQDRRPAQNIGELDIHVGNVQEMLRDLKGSMATKTDIEGIRSAMVLLASKEELQSKIDGVTAKVDTLAAEVQRGKLGTLFRNLVLVASGVLTLIGLVGAFALMVRMADRVPPAAEVKLKP